MLPLIMQLSLYAPIFVVVAAAVVAIVCLALQVLLPQHHPALPTLSHDSHDSFNLDF